MYVAQESIYAAAQLDQIHLSRRRLCLAKNESEKWKSVEATRIREVAKHRETTEKNAAERASTIMAAVTWDATDEATLRAKKQSLAAVKVSFHCVSPELPYKAVGIPSVGDTSSFTAITCC